MSLPGKLTALVALGLLVSGCSDSSSTRVDRPDADVDFTTFVKTELNNTGAEREPTPINDITFSFNDQTNEQAFNDVLQ